MLKLRAKLFPLSFPFLNYICYPPIPSSSKYALSGATGHILLFGCFFLSVILIQFIKQVISHTFGDMIVVPKGGFFFGVS